MYAEVLAEKEGDGPAPNFLTTPQLSDGALQLDRPALWRRLEDWMSHRWGVRTVTWRLRGPGLWEPRLTPASVTVIDTWDADASEWRPATLQPDPMGYALDPFTYRVTADVGEDSDPPPTVKEAYRRLAEYVAEAETVARGASAVSERTGDLSVSTRRPTNWMAMALQNSGAADLLRRYRRVI